MTGERITKCPVCGGEIQVSFLCQYSQDCLLTKKGRVSRKYKMRDNGSMDIAVASCLSCGEYWDADEFSIDAQDYFIDHKERRK